MEEWMKFQRKYTTFCKILEEQQKMGSAKQSFSRVKILFLTAKVNIIGKYSDNLRIHRCITEQETHKTKNVSYLEMKGWNM